MMLTKKLQEDIKKALNSDGHITFLVGAGVSAESGIPTFRGPEGYWKVGSVNYKPQEIGTFSMFLDNPTEVWKWFLFRKTVCREAFPNKGHYALAELEQLLENRFALVSQNVDGLHIRAGNTLDRLYPIHGDLSYARCGAECSEELYPFPDHISKNREENLTEEEIASLKCKKCGNYLRPHVLWFDESYNEQFYKAQSTLDVANNTDMLFIIGTSGATTLPHLILDIAFDKEVPIVVIDINKSLFAKIAELQSNGYFIQAKSGEVLPLIVEMIKEIQEK